MTNPNMGPHQRQYIYIDKNIPEETQISLLATGRNLNYEIIEFGDYSAVENIKRAQFITILSLLSLLYDSNKLQHVILIGGPNLKTVEYLDTLFPNLTWEIRLNPRTSRKRNIKTFNDTINLRYTYQPPKQEAEVILFSFIQDLNSNYKIVKHVSPIWSLLPFEIQQNKIKYFEGKLLNIVWNGRESLWRNLLVARNAKMIEHEKEIYHLNCFNFNYDYRARFYPTYFVDKNFDHCYDCAMENSLWELYMLKMGRQADSAIIANYMKTLNQYLNDF